jgi:hypothetical protein
LGSSRLSISEELCYSSIKAGIKRLCDIKTWPRPHAARRLRVGYDFYRDQMKNIQEVNDLIEYLASDDDIKSIYFAQSGRSEHWVLYEFWELLLLRMLSEIEGIAPSRRIFQKWFRRFFKELYSPIAVWRIVDTVTGLSLRGNELNLDEATTLISRPAHHLPSNIWGPQQYPLEGRLIPYNWLSVGLDKAVIVTTVRIPKCQYAGSCMPYPHLTMDIERSIAVIDAIRLTKSGAPRLHCYTKFHVSHFPLYTPLAFCRDDGNLRLYEDEAILDRSDFLRVRNTWRELMNTKYKDIEPTISKLTPMDTAFGGFSRSYEMRSWLDNIVDLTIALESLFGPKDNQELRHRISLRAAWLLSGDDGEGQARLKNKIYDYVRTMYDIRSCRVHGDIPKDSEIRKWVQTLSGLKYDRHDRAEKGRLIELALESGRDIVRNALLACMNLQKLDPTGPQWPLPDDFDQNIVIPGQRKVWQKAAGIRSQK